MRHDKESINLGNTITYLTGRFRDGLRAIPGSPLRLLLAVLFWLATAIMIHAAAADNIVVRLLRPFFWILAGLLFLAVVTATAIPPGTLRMANACRRIGLVNDCGEAPLLIKRYHKEEKIMMDLFTQGISLAEIQDNLAELEAAANCRIVRVEQGASRNIIRLTLAPGNAQLPEKVNLPRLTIALSEIAMGVSYDGPVITDLNKMPHWLMGGATGSGKTTLLVVFVQQCLMKVTATGEQAVDVYIIDLKGGQDYPPALAQPGLLVLRHRRRCPVRAGRAGDGAGAAAEAVLRCQRTVRRALLQPGRLQPPVPRCPPAAQRHCN